MSTNKPSIGPVVLEIATVILRKNCQISILHQKQIYSKQVVYATKYDANKLPHQRCRQQNQKQYRIPKFKLTFRIFIASNSNNSEKGPAWTQFFRFNIGLFAFPRGRFVHYIIEH